MTLNGNTLFLNTATEASSTNSKEEIQRHMLQHKDTSRRRVFSTETQKSEEDSDQEHIRVCMRLLETVQRFSRRAVTRQSCRPQRTRNPNVLGRIFGANRANQAAEHGYLQHCVPTGSFLHSATTSANVVDDQAGSTVHRNELHRTSDAPKHVQDSLPERILLPSAARRHIGRHSIQQIPKSRRAAGAANCHWNKATRKKSQRACCKMRRGWLLETR